MAPEASPDILLAFAAGLLSVLSPCVLPLLPAYRRKFGHKPGDFPIAESVSHRTIALPFFTRLTEHEVGLVCQTLELMMTRIQFARD